MDANGIIWYKIESRLIVYISAVRSERTRKIKTEIDGDVKLEIKEEPADSEDADDECPLDIKPDIAMAWQTKEIIAHMLYEVSLDKFLSQL